MKRRQIPGAELHGTKAVGIGEKGWCEFDEEQGCLSVILQPKATKSRLCGKGALARGPKEDGGGPGGTGVRAREVAGSWGRRAWGGGGTA